MPNIAAVRNDITNGTPSSTDSTEITMTSSNTLYMTAAELMSQLSHSLISVHYTITDTNQHVNSTSIMLLTIHT